MSGGWIGSNSSVASLPCAHVRTVGFGEGKGGEAYGVLEDDFHPAGVFWWVLDGFDVEGMMGGTDLVGTRSRRRLGPERDNVSHPTPVEEKGVTYMDNNPAILCAVVLRDFGARPRRLGGHGGGSLE